MHEAEFMVWMKELDLMSRGKWISVKSHCKEKRVVTSFSARTCKQLSAQKSSIAEADETFFLSPSRGNVT